MRAPDSCRASADEVGYVRQVAADRVSSAGKRAAAADGTLANSFPAAGPAPKERQRGPAALGPQTGAGPPGRVTFIFSLRMAACSSAFDCSGQALQSFSGTGDTAPAWVPP